MVHSSVFNVREIQSNVKTNREDEPITCPSESCAMSILRDVGNDRTGVTTCRDVHRDVPHPC